ncbi:putative short-chain dehydrogenase [Massarina eburnea CBS 473.64]|uniref:Putative short-chain dehydrogenase n=1 Tax=Massarina eburnea CBS 473.64 TaxID=1395130 RepID=A0A6A6SEC7_9PLEO|nr:putative short-chain dehydrogenase [Massarina eburnea CBS 473.64]
MSSNTGLYPGDRYFKPFTKTWHNKPYPQTSPLLPELRTTGSVVFIAIFGRRIDKLQGETTAIVEAIDLSQSTTVDAAFVNAMKKAAESQIDIFIHNAGILQTNGAAAGYDYDNFRNGLDFNLTGAFNTIQTMLPLLAHQAKVFLISSCIAHVSLMPSSWAYAATKIANTKMSDYVQAENPNLHVVNVHPGVVNTDMNASTEPEGVRVDDVDLPAHFLAWLESGDAEFLKGKFVWVNWDVVDLKDRADEIK